VSIKPNGRESNSSSETAIPHVKYLESKGDCTVPNESQYTDSLSSDDTSISALPVAIWEADGLTTEAETSSQKSDGHVTSPCALQAQTTATQHTAALTYFIIFNSPYFKNQEDTQ
jgi:hypothetical protein